MNLPCKNTETKPGLGLLPKTLLKIKVKYGGKKNNDNMLIYQSKDGKNEDRCTFRRRNSVAVLGSNVQTFWSRP